MIDQALALGDIAAREWQAKTAATQDLDFGLFEQGRFWGAFRLQKHAEEELERLERMFGHSSKAKAYRRWTIRERSGDVKATVERNKRKEKPDRE